MKERIIIIMPTCNAAKTLERTYHSILTRYFEEVSSVHFYHCVVYGFAMLVKFITHKWRGAKVPQFSKQLRDIISRYHHTKLFREER